MWLRIRLHFRRSKLICRLFPSRRHSWVLPISEMNLRPATKVTKHKFEIDWGGILYAAEDDRRIASVIVTGKQGKVLKDANQVKKHRRCSRFRTWRSLWRISKLECRLKSLILSAARQKKEQQQQQPARRKNEQSISCFNGRWIDDDASKSGAAWRLKMKGTWSKLERTDKKKKTTSDIVIRKLEHWHGFQIKTRRRRRSVVVSWLKKYQEIVWRNIGGIS